MDPSRRSLMSSLGNVRQQWSGAGYTPIPPDDPTAFAEAEGAERAETMGPRRTFGAIEGAGRASVGLQDHVTVWEGLVQKWKDGHFTIVPEDNRWMDAWDILVISALIVTALLVPFEVAYYSTVPWSLQVLDSFTNLIFLCDIGVTFNTAYVVINPMVSIDLYERSPIKIARRYVDVPFVNGMNNGWFWPDLLTILPWDMISGGVASVRMLRVLKLLRMFRLVRVVKLLSRWHHHLGLSYAVVNIGGCMLLTLTSIHWFACLWGAAGRDAPDGTETWLRFYIDSQLDEPKDNEESELYVYVLAVYYVAMTLTGVGFGDVVPRRQTEVLISTGFIFLLGFMWAYVIAVVTSIITKFDEAKMHFQQMNDDLAGIMETRGLTASLQMRIRRHICESFRVYRQRHQQQTIRCLSAGLQGDIALASGADKICGCIWYLRDIERDVLIELVNFFLPDIYSPSEWIIHKDCVSVICRGTCWQKFHVITRDAVIGEDMLLHSEHLRETVHPRTLTFVEVMKLSRNDLRHVCLMFADFAHRIRRAQVRLAVRRGVVYYAKHMKALDDHGLRRQHTRSIHHEVPRLCNTHDPLNEIDFKLIKVQDLLEAQLNLHPAEAVGRDAKAQPGDATQSDDVARSLGHLSEVMERHFKEASADRRSMLDRFLAASGGGATAEQRSPAEPEVRLEALRRGAVPAGGQPWWLSASSALAEQRVPESEISPSSPLLAMKPVLDQLARMEQQNAARDAGFREQLGQLSKQQASLEQQTAARDMGVREQLGQLSQQHASFEQQTVARDMGVREQLGQISKQQASFEQQTAARDVGFREQLGQLSQQQALLTAQLGRFEARESGEREGAQTQTRSVSVADMELVGYEGPLVHRSPRSMSLEAFAANTGQQLCESLLRRIEVAEQRLALQVEQVERWSKIAAGIFPPQSSPSQQPPATEARMEEALLHALPMSARLEDQELQLCVEAERKNLSRAVQSQSAMLASTVSTQLEDLGVTLRRSVDTQLEALRSSLDEIFSHRGEGLKTHMSSKLLHLHAVQPRLQSQAKVGVASPVAPSSPSSPSARSPTRAKSQVDAATLLRTIQE